MKTIYRQPEESIDHLINRYKRWRNKDGIPEEIKKRAAYMKPGDKRRMKHDRAVARLRKGQRIKR